jgi:hypothetical protein
MSLETSECRGDAPLGIRVFDAVAGGKPSQAHPVHADLSVVKLLDSASVNLCG